MSKYRDSIGSLLAWCVIFAFNILVWVAIIYTFIALAGALRRIA